MQAPATPLWFAVPAVTIVVLPLLGRRCLPFTAPVLGGLALSTAARPTLRVRTASGAPA